MREGESMIILAVFVDDLIVAATDSKNIETVEELLKTKFKLKNLGKLKYFLGIDITKKDGIISLNQEGYIA